MEQFLAEETLKKSSRMFDVGIQAEPAMHVDPLKFTIRLKQKHKISFTFQLSQKKFFSLILFFFELISSTYSGWTFTLDFQKANWIAVQFFRGS